MIFSFFQLLALFIIFLSISLNINFKFCKILFSLIAGVIISAEALSFYLTGKFIDYQFYIHANLESIKEFGSLFTYQTIFFIILIMLISMVFYKISKILFKKLDPIKYIYIISIILSCSAILSVQNGIFRELYDTYKILNSKANDFNVALNGLGVSPNEYIFRDQIKAKPGKNIIVISVESLERGYFDFANLMPNLQKLKQEWTFLDMDQGYGSGWTSGSFYTHQTGFPMIFSSHGNETLNGAISSKITSLADVLHKAGYDVKYIMNRPEFAGVKDLMRIYNIDSINEKNCVLNQNNTWNWNNKHYLYDLDAFEELKLQISDKLKAKGPFAIFLSTINTHFPNGIYDKRMEKYVSKKENNLEFCVASVDYLIGNLVDFLKNEGVLKNTSIYIFPDHLLMGNGNMTSVHKKLKAQKRALYLLTNEKFDSLPYGIKKPIQQIDLPRLILSGANVQTNAKFLSDFIDVDKSKFIKDNLNNILAVNNASLENKSIMSGIKIFIDENRVNVVSNDGYSESIKFDNAIRLISSAFPEAYGKNPSKIQIGADSIKPKRGLNLIIIDNKLSFKSYDALANKQGLQDFVTDIQSIKNKKFIVVAHDSIGNSSKEIREKLSSLGFEILSKITGRVAYIATNIGKNNKLIELDGNKTISLNLKNEISTSNDGYYVFNLSKRGFILSKRKTSYSDLQNDDKLKIIVSIQNNRIKQVYLGDNITKIVKSGDDIQFSEDEVRTILNQENLAKIDNAEHGKNSSLMSNSKKIKVEDNNYTKVLVTSDRAYLNLDSHVEVNGVSLKGINVENNLNLITKVGEKINLDIYKVSDKIAVDNFIKKIKTIYDNNQTFIVLGANLKNKNLKIYERELNKLGFKDLIYIKNKTAYLAYNVNKIEITEITSKQFINIGIDIFNDEELNVKVANEVSNKIRNEKMRFIAHAGGSIDGYVYTNSLEALNLNYEKGFRLFELDIIKTSDGHFVGAHDWKHWASITNYKGKNPPNLEEFKKYKIYNQFTPLDMKDINAWFAKHKDAFLITDKVNSPKDFAEQFIDKERLKMELFTWEAIEEAIKYGVTAMPSGTNLLRDTEKLQKLHIKYGVAFIGSLKKNKNLFKSLKNNGIKVYAFLIGKSELDAICKSNEYFYGLYVDKFDFKKKIDCYKY